MSDYWLRREKEMEHIIETFRNDTDYKNELNRLYSQLERDVQTEIDSFMNRYAGSENVSMAEATKRVSDADVVQLNEKAKRYVKEKDFSPRAKEELKVYNLKMKTSRLDMLLNNIRLDTIATANAEDRLLTGRLVNEVWSELERQAGILGKTVPSGEQIKRMANVIVNADYKGATFSERVWNNQSVLQNDLDKAMRRVLIQGKGPREASRELRKNAKGIVNSKKYEADRIAITESARVQAETQLASFKEFDIKQTQWIAEPDACDICSQFDGKVYYLGEVPDLPQHPFCRCSLSGVVDRDEIDRDLTARGL